MQLTPFPFSANAPSLGRVGGQALAHSQASWAAEECPGQSLLVELSQCQLQL